MVAVTDKRKVVDDAPSTEAMAAMDEKLEPKRVDLEQKKDPTAILMEKVFVFVMNQPEYYEILKFPQPVRKQIARDIAKVMTRFPHYTKVGLSSVE